LWRRHGVCAESETGDTATNGGFCGETGMSDSSDGGSSSSGSGSGDDDDDDDFAAELEAEMEVEALHTLSLLFLFQTPAPESIHSRPETLDRGPWTLDP